MVKVKKRETPLYLIGLDVGGTKIEACLIEAMTEAAATQSQSHGQVQVPSQLIFGTPQGQIYSCSILKRLRVATERELGYKHVLEKINGLIQDVCRQASISFSQIKSIGVGLPGAIDPGTKKMHNGNSQIFINQDFVNDLKKSFLQIQEHEQSKFNPDVIIEVENDANCFALAEILCGVGVRFFKDFHIPLEKQIGIGIILGTGCGGGAVIQGQLFRGRHGGAMEIGHTQLKGSDFPCYCGRVGCAETVLSGNGVSESYFQQFGERKEAPEIFELAKNNNLRARKILNEYRQYLLEFLVNLTNLFDPDYFVLGGGVAKEHQIYSGLNELLFKKSFVKKSRPQVYQFSLGDSAGVIGAALLIFQENF